MKNLNSIPVWGWSCIVLAVIALFFLVCMRGYQYISLSLIFVAFLILIGNVASRPVKIVIFTLAGIGFAYFLFVEALVISNSKNDADSNNDYVIVLGAAVHGDEPSLALLHRLQSTLTFMNTYPNVKAVVCGGQGDGENITEAKCMRDWLVSNGIDAGRIIMEDRSTSTMENLAFARELIIADGGRIDNTAIVTSSYHLYRAKMMAVSLGYTAPGGIRAVMGYPVYMLGMYIREAFGVTHFWILGD